MKSYKDFEKVYIGSSDIAALTVRSSQNVYNLQFGADGCYDAYEVMGEASIGSRYTKEFSGAHWLKIYDDKGLVYYARHPNMLVDIYTAGDYGCIIQWHGSCSMA